MSELQGKRIAFIATHGVEQVELTEPWKAVEEAGGKPVLIGLESGSIQGYRHLDKGDTFDVDVTTGSASVDDYDGLVLPGGTVNADKVRADESAVDFVRETFRSGKPIAAICHGPWALVEAGVVEGLTLTSFPSLKTDIRNAGGDWVDSESETDAGITTSRTPEDLPAFCAKLVEEMAEGDHSKSRSKLPAMQRAGAGA